MNRQEKLDLEADVYDAWVERYKNVKDFDPENPTIEQLDDYYSANLKAFPPQKGTFAYEVANMSEAELEELRKLSIYQEQSNLPL